MCFTHLGIYCCDGLEGDKFLMTVIIIRERRELNHMALLLDVKLVVKKGKRDK